MMDVWSQLRYFKKDSKVDRWGQPSAMDELLLRKLDDLRHFIGCPIYVTSGFRAQKPASRMSQHWFGRAVDVVAPTYHGHLMDFYMAAERFFFKGIGVYPDWEFQGKICGGLHLDERELAAQDDELDFRGARWIGVAGSEGQVYVGLSFENLVNYGVITDNDLDIYSPVA